MAQEWIKAPIDEKNICSDFLAEIADDYYALESQPRPFFHQSAFYWKGELCEAKWDSRDNVMRFFCHGNKSRYFVCAFIECLKELFVEQEHLRVDFMDVNESVFELHFWHR